MSNSLVEGFIGKTFSSRPSDLQCQLERRRLGLARRVEEPLDVAEDLGEEGGLGLGVRILRAIRISVAEISGP